ncbi:transposase [Rhodococcus opacus]|nr:transposase [Rhodococcus opacus]
MEAGYRDRVVVGAVEGPAAGVAAAVAGRVRQVLAQADRLPAVQRKGRSKDSATYYANCLPTAAGGSGGRAVRTPGHSVVEAATGGGRTVAGDGVASCLVVGTTSRFSSRTRSPSPRRRSGGWARCRDHEPLHALDGGKVTKPRHEGRDRERLARAQRVLAGKAKGSGSRAKARLRVAKICWPIADRRRDYCTQLSTRLVRENQVIAARI